MRSKTDTFRVGKTRAYANIEAFEWEIGKVGSSLFIEIPEREFESSIPWWASWFISPDDPQFLKAALIHDHMLEEGVYGRKQSAAEWYDAAISAAAPKWKAKVAYIALAIHACYLE